MGLELLQLVFQFLQGILNRRERDHNDCNGSLCAQICQVVPQRPGDRIEVRRRV